MPAFKLYDIKVLLGGSRNNEVRKFCVTAPEVQLLGSIHGPDSVPEINPAHEWLRDPKTGVTKKGKPMAAVSRSDGEERQRLADIYERTSPARVGFVRRLFGPSTLPLPKEMEKGYRATEKVNPDNVPDGLRDHIDADAALM